MPLSKMPDSTREDYIQDSAAVEQKDLEKQKDLLVEASTDSSRAELETLSKDIVGAQKEANTTLEKNENKDKITMVKEISDFFKDPQNVKKHQNLYNEYESIKEKVMNALNSDVDYVTGKEEKKDLNKVDDSRDANSLDMQRWDEEEKHVSETDSWSASQIDKETASENADRVLAQQPKKYNDRKAELDDVLANGTQEQKGKIYNAINSMPEISDIYERVEAAKNLD